MEMELVNLGVGDLGYWDWDWGLTFMAVVGGGLVCGI